jgi:diguanylate cyclase (GGDEF)-like protein
MVRSFARASERLRLSLRAQVVFLVVGVAILAGGSVGVAMVESARGALRDEALRSNLAAADLAAALTADYMEGIWGSARDLAANPRVRRAAGNDDFASVTWTLAAWLGQNPRADDAAIYDLHGVNRADGQADQSVVGVANVWNRPWFQAALANGVPQQGGATISRTSGRPAAPFHVPILNEAGNMRGMLSAVISLAALSDTLQHADLGTNARVSLVDLTQGIYLASADPQHILQPVADLGEATHGLSAGERGTTEAIGPNGATLVAYAPVRGLAWGVLVEQPSVDAFAPIVAMAVHAAGWGALAVALAAAAGRAAAARLTRPLHKLQQAAARLESTMALLRTSEKQSRRESERLLALHAASSALSAHTATPSAVLDQILSSAVTLLHASSGSIYRWDADASLLRCVRNWRIPAADTTPDLRVNEGIAGQAFGRGAPIICNDYATADYATASGKRGGMRAGLGVPLLWGGSPIGVLLVRVYADEITRFDEDDARLTSLFGDQASAAMFTAEAFDRQRLAALHDALTGLPNRLMLRDRLHKALVVEGEASSTALLLLDLDRFKEVNDTLGHAIGDLLLREVGRRLSSALRTSDLVARLGGDEFCVLLGGTSSAGAEQVAASLVDLIDQPYALEGHLVSIGVSIGVASFPEHGLTAEVLMRHADLAMYAAKRAGTGWSVYGESPLPELEIAS